MLTRMEEEDPHLPFVNFYQALVDKYARDATENARLVWNNIKLDMGNEKVMTLAVFQKNAQAFLLARTRVKNWTPVEEYGLIFRQLPKF